MQVAVTGARGIRKGEERRAEQMVRDHLGALKVGVSEFTSGAAWGVDTIASLAALDLWGGDCVHRLVVPAAPHNDELVATFERKRLEGEPVLIERMPDGTTYMDRNDRLITYAEMVVAFPSTQYEQQRSGTWATVRRARRKMIPLMIVPLDGTPGWIE